MSGTFKSGFLRVTGGGTIHYRRLDNGKPPLLLAHGLFDDLSAWNEIVPFIAEVFDPVMYDARGHGLSERHNEDYDKYRWEDMASVVAALDIKRCGVIGHSMGGNTAATMASKYPDLFAFMILEDPVWTQVEPIEYRPDLPRVPTRFEKWLLKTLALPHEQAIESCRQLMPGWSEKQYEEWMESKRKFDFAILEHFRWGKYPWQPMIEKIRCPSLLLTANPQKGGMVPQEVSEFVRTRNPLFRIANFPEANHYIRRSASAGYRACIKDFLSDVKSGSRLRETVANLLSV